MTFNEQNTIENVLRDHLVGKPVTAQTVMVAEETAEYIKSNRDLMWKYVNGEKSCALWQATAGCLYRYLVQVCVVPIE